MKKVCFKNFTHCFIFIKHIQQGCFFIIFLVPYFFASAQKIAIHQRSNLVVNGNVFLVVNNAAFTNDGAFSAGGGTVKFSGFMDTTIAYLNGISTTTFNNLTINNPAYGTALKSAASVVNTLGVYGGNLYADNNLTLLSGINSTARVDAVTAGSDIKGIAKVERYIQSRRAWRLMTAPVTNSSTIFNCWQNGGLSTGGRGTYVTGPSASGPAGNGLDISPQNNVSVKGYNYATQLFVSVLNTKVPISAGSSGSADNTGYFIFLRGDRDPTNFIVPNSDATIITSIGKLQTGTQVFSVSPVTNNYSLIGNPYASPVDFNNVSLTNLIKRFYVWDPTLNAQGGYVMLDDFFNTGTYTTTVLGSAQTKDIQSGQAFFVQTNSSAPASVTFNESSKSGNYIAGIFRPASPGTVQNIPSSFRISLYLLNAGNTTILADGSLTEFSNKFSDKVGQEDGIKFSNINESISLLRQSISLALERRPAINVTDTLFLKLTKTTQRAYQFQFNPAAFNIDLTAYLQDNYLNTSVMLSLVNPTTINFSIDNNAASAAADRFKIVFKQISLNPLPVTVTNLQVSLVNKNAAVQWKVENEINIEQYDVEKSTDGIHFLSVHSIKVTGNNNTPIYNWLDENAGTANIFYRIKIYSSGQQITYSLIVKVAINLKGSAITVYPNTIKNNTISLQINNEPTGNYQLTLSNNIGQVFYTGAIQNNSSISSYLINLNTKPATGLYYLKIAGPQNKVTTKKIIIE